MRLHPGCAGSNHVETGSHRRFIAHPGSLSVVDKKKDRPEAVSPKSDQLRWSDDCLGLPLQAATFRLLRQPAKPIMPRPDMKSGRAAGIGVAVTFAYSNAAWPVSVNLT